MVMWAGCIQEFGGIRRPVFKIWPSSKQMCCLSCNSCSWNICNSSAPEPTLNLNHNETTKTFCVMLLLIFYRRELIGWSDICHGSPNTPGYTLCLGRTEPKILLVLIRTVYSLHKSLERERVDKKRQSFASKFVVNAKRLQRQYTNSWKCCLVCNVQLPLQVAFWRSHKLWGRTKFYSCKLAFCVQSRNLTHWPIIALILKT